MTTAQRDAHSWRKHSHSFACPSLHMEGALPEILQYLVLTLSDMSLSVFGETGVFRSS